MACKPDRETLFLQELGRKIEPNCGRFLVRSFFGEKASFPSALTCRSMPARARRNYAGRRKCNRIKSNLARGFKPRWVHREEGQQCLLAGCQWKRLRSRCFHFGGRSRY